MGRSVRRYGQLVLPVHRVDGFIDTIRFLLFTYQCCCFTSSYDECLQKLLSAGLRPYVSCNPRSTAAFPRITPVEPPDVNINKKRSAKSAELVLSCNKLGFPRYELNQLKIFVPVGKDIKIVTPVK